MTLPEGFRFAIDRGGTFTDIFAEVPGEPGFRTLKLLSENPDHYPDAALEGIRRIIEDVTGSPLPAGPLNIPDLQWIRMGTTLATNALLERKGTLTGLVITRGFGDLLEIGKQNRPRLFDLEIKKNSVLYQAVVEVEERVRVVHASEESSTSSFGTIGNRQVEVEASPDLETLRGSLQGFLDQGIRSLAVVLMHSYVFPDHEKAVGDLARSMGFDHVSLSSEVMPRIKMVDRGHTTLVDAYLTPVIRDYIRNFRQGLREPGPGLWFMQSDGGMIEADRFSGGNAILSGPAGGIAGYARTAWNPEDRVPVIGFDMGGTSTDVSRFDGEFDWVHETELAGIYLQSPQLNIHTVAAGGGSRLFYRNGMFVVGPESAGAFPGPAGYRNQGPLALTDANVLLGRVHPDFFPKVFGPDENLPLDVEASRHAFNELLESINTDLKSRGMKPMSLEEAAEGFVTVANEQMARAVRQVTLARGHDVRGHKLATFGGAGAQHACALARTLGIRQVHIHRFAGILSAYGLGLAEMVEEEQEPASLVLDETTKTQIESRLESLRQGVKDRLVAQGFVPEDVVTNEILHLRYEGTDQALAISAPDNGDYLKAFSDEWQRLYGFKAESRQVWVDVIRVRAVGRPAAVSLPPLEEATQSPVPVQETSCYLMGAWHTVPVYEHESLGAGSVIQSPALIVQQGSTIVLEPDCTARVGKTGDIEIEVPEEEAPVGDTEFDPVRLSLFGNRFMAIAEEMGRVLQHTAVSTNIKERHDFSCALFSKKGDLIANAPHQPVHLGSMGEAVKAQIRIHAQDIQPGVVWVSNHPAAGGTHLPDITVITPVFEGTRLLFFVASRGHHADIGGTVPGSMPPFASCLAEEGAALESFTLVSGGVFQDERIRARLLASPGQDGQGKPIPGARAIEDNLSDLKAQVAANQRGIDLMLQLTRTYTLSVVEAYMGYIRRAASEAVRERLQSLWRSGFCQVEAQDCLDDGTPIQLRLTVHENGKARFDFTGSGDQVPGNLNAPPAVSISAILYCLRCLVAGDMPLNQGCLEPVEIDLPPGSLLHPSREAAIAAGNVLTSQRVVDVVLKAFGAAAASQGCMNNFIFGNEQFAYYETIGGGSGAGPNWHGASGVHTHMTNTRITDPEILEHRYPVVLREFSIRRNSGGTGKFRGGDGLIREVEFLQGLQVAILSERRTVAPYGLQGGGPGQCGENYRIRVDGSSQKLQGKCELEIVPGERIRILTPGGGGYGRPDSS